MAVLINLYWRRVHLLASCLALAGLLLTKPQTAAAQSEKAKAAIEAKNQPIDFWGQIIGYTGSAMTSTTIDAQVRHWGFGGPTGVSLSLLKTNILTDATGAFHISGVSGDDLELKIRKAGYELEPTAKLEFGYGTADRFCATRDVPFLFRLWPTNLHYKLICGKYTWHVIPDGRDYFIDLKKGTISDAGSGEIQLSIKRPMTIERNVKYERISQITVVHGGLLEETNRTSSLYIAPRTGYVPEFQLSQKIVGSQRVGTGRRKFYFRLDDGKIYGRIDIELISPYNAHVPALVNVDYAFNPTGSPVLR